MDTPARSGPVPEPVAALSFFAHHPQDGSPLSKLLVTSWCSWSTTHGRLLEAHEAQYGHDGQHAERAEPSPGQAGRGQRREAELPARRGGQATGESHHLATTVPPETWERVLVIQWPALLTRIPAPEAQRAEQLGLADCGLGIEYLLQITYRPLLTARRRSTAGGWSTRHIETSRSRGAAASTHIPELFKAVQAQWDRLSAAAAPRDGHAAIYSDAGRAVFPGSL